MMLSIVICHSYQLGHRLNIGKVMIGNTFLRTSVTTIGMILSTLFLDGSLTSSKSEVEVTYNYWETDKKVEKTAFANVVLWESQKPDTLVKFEHKAKLDLQKKPPQTAAFTVNLPDRYSKLTWGDIMKSKTIKCILEGQLAGAKHDWIKCKHIRGAREIRKNLPLQDVLNNLTINLTLHSFIGEDPALTMIVRYQPE